MFLIDGLADGAQLKGTMSFKMQRVTTLKLPGQEEAQKLLEKVAWQVEPIMRKHGWTVPLLAEFLPKNEGLLGLNHNKGAKIQVRLRQTKESGLMPYESALGTTLHELVHCDIGAHSAEFYKMLDELNAEADALEAKGLGGSGAGFDADGQQLSGTSHNPTNLRDARLAAVTAAEKRTQKRSLGMAPGGGGHVLGGRRPAAALPPAQMAALAAQRRGADEKWCSSHLPVLEEVPDWLEPAAAGGGAAAAAAPAAAKPRPVRTGPAAAAALARLQPQVARGGAAKRAAAESAKQPVLKRRRQPAPAAAAAEPRQQSSAATKWSCSQCTLLNDSGSSTCSVCSHPALPAAAAAGGPVRRLGQRTSAATKPPPAQASPEVIELLDSDSD